MSRRLITVIGGLPAALGCVLGYLLVCSTLLAILFPWRAATGGVVLDRVHVGDTGHGEP
jgi:hypothetical protein